MGRFVRGTSTGGEPVVADRLITVETTAGDTILIDSEPTSYT